MGLLREFGIYSEQSWEELKSFALKKYSEDEKIGLFAEKGGLKLGLQIGFL